MVLQAVEEYLLREEEEDRCIFFHIPYKRKFSRVSNFAILWSKVESLFSRVQFFANLKIHQIWIPDFSRVCRQKTKWFLYTCTCNFGIDRFTNVPVYTCTQVDRLFMKKKIFKHLNLLYTLYIPQWGPGGLSRECVFRISMRVVKGD